VRKSFTMTVKLDSDINYVLTNIRQWVGRESFFTLTVTKGHKIMNNKR